MSETITDKGTFLKQVRESKGISLGAVHEATKIPLDSLRAIEEGYKVRTLSPFYLKGFLKMYANYLEVDIKAVVDDYHPEKLPQHEKIIVEKADILEKLNKVFTKERKRQIFIGLGIILALWGIMRIFGSLKKSSLVEQKKPVIKMKEEKRKPIEKKQETIKKEVKNINEPPAAKVKEVAPQAVTTPPPSVSKPAHNPSSAEQKIAAKTVELTVRAKRNSWLQVKVDGILIFQSTLKQGVSETWTANEIIELSGKNISHLDFELNGKLIGSLGRQDRTARKVIITKDGLSVKK